MQDVETGTSFELEYVRRFEGIPDDENQGLE